MKHIFIFDGLRGVLALWVLFYHVFSIFEFPVPMAFDGRHAVSVFLVLSGFVISKLIFEKKINYSSYILQRFLRLYPIYFICMIIALILIQKNIMPINWDQNYTYQHLILHFFMMHGALPVHIIPGADSAILNPAWSVSVEWQFYIIAPLLFYLIKCRSSMGAIILIIVTVASKRYIVENFNFNSASIFFQIPIFMIGIYSYFFWRFIEKSQKLITDTELKILTIIGFLFVTIFSISEYIWLGIWMFVFGVAVNSQYSKKYPFLIFLSDILSSKILVWLGSISYSLYLVHEPIIWLCIEISKNYFQEFSNSSQFVLINFIVLILSLLFSNFLHILVERPAIAYGKRILK